MSSNAGTWFYQEPENKPYLVAERLNSSFWTARLVYIYWQCTQAEAPFTATGYVNDEVVSLAWIPNEWLRFTAPNSLSEDLRDTIVQTISRRVLNFEASLTYADPDGSLSVEWYRDGGSDRWDEIQGQPGYVLPQRL